MSMGRVYLLGIGGIAMANVAVLLKSAGFDVQGSDQNVYEPAASILRRSGIVVKTPYAASNLPEGTDTIIVVGNVQSRGQVEVEEALRRNLRLESFPGLLRRTVMLNKLRIVVAGTHGKSTTTACVAHLLKHCALDPSYLIGADPINLDFGGQCGSGNCFVIEGDEYDSAFFDKRSKFLDYFPHILILGRVEHDHLDIFPTLDEMLLSYRRVIAQLPDNGLLVVAADSKAALELADNAPCKLVKVGFEASCDWRIAGRDLYPPTQRDPALDFAAGVLGAHNRLNTAMAFAAIADLVDDYPALTAAARSFRGIRRRLECVLRSDNLLVFDDFAHHPTAVAAAINAVREQYPDYRIIAVFEPRSNTATRSLYQREFTDALALSDMAVIGSVHRASRIADDVKLNTEQIVEDLAARGVPAAVVANLELPAYLSERIGSGPHVVLFMSNGSFDGACKKFCDLSEARSKVTA